MTHTLNHWLSMLTKSHPMRDSNHQFRFHMATNHMTYDLILFQSYTSISDKDHVITLRDGRKVNVQSIGTVCLNNGVKLKDVLYVPEFHFNLISISKLRQDISCHVLFTSNGCFVQDQLTKTQWLLGRQVHGLYHTTARLTSPSSKIDHTISSKDCKIQNKSDACKLYYYT